MKRSSIVNTVLKVAEKAAAVDLEEAGKKAADTVRKLDGKAIVKAIGVNTAERIERRTEAALDIAYLIANLDGWFSEKQEACFEKIASQLGKKPSDVSADAVGLNAKLAHLRDRVSEEELLESFIAECRPLCETFDGMLIPSRRAFALWITLGLADGEMRPLFRKALELLRREFKHSALLFGALGVAASGGLGLFSAILGGMHGLKHKQTFDELVPLISKDFLEQAERIIAEASALETLLAASPDPEKQARYDALVAELETLIAPPRDDEDDEDDED